MALTMARVLGRRVCAGGALYSRSPLCVGHGALYSQRVHTFNYCVGYYCVHNEAKSGGYCPMYSTLLDEIRRNASEAEQRHKLVMEKLKTSEERRLEGLVSKFGQKAAALIFCFHVFGVLFGDVIGFGSFLYHLPNSLSYIIKFLNIWIGRFERFDWALAKGLRFLVILLERLKKILEYAFPRDPDQPE